MTPTEIQHLILNGEKIDVEFKESKTTLTKDVFDTVCSFNNRNGGHILLGINDNKEIIGINKQKAEKIIKEFTTAINNPQKIFPPLYLIPEKIEINNNLIIYIRVPEGYQVCRHNGKILDRSYEGDINITNNSELVYKMYARKQNTYFVNKVYPNLKIDFLDTKLISKARKMAKNKLPNHPWGEMDDQEMLRSTNLILVDPETNKEGITLAAILLFGKDNSIMSVLPQHKTDAIFRVENQDRYDDRDVVITNLIDSYERLLAFGQKHLNDLFFLDGIHNISARDCILREIISNTLVHRDYSSGFPARIIIDNEAITIENSNLAHKMGTLDLLQFKPYPKNPTISKVFREMGLADELDSGMRNTYKYTKLYSDSIPLFEEGNIFKTIIPLRKIATQKVGNASQDVSQDVSHNVPKNITPYSKEERILIIKKHIKENNKITRKAIADELGVDLKTIQRDINKIDNLKYIGRGSNGHWEFEE
ncbi:helix-turn-helix domain-containing protein [Pasteurella atlantica]|uniref:AlbA family DNA-binding domain-containing protein n=1 Tax=Pasteurellaceae TaxID=712 RepID=UPI00274DEB84|nr:helix-turn-helix domain-containing protein [Pasteurella atlantica]MDP8034423.1 helix-turn-helix domain-containing protein [Pasteurella atlantica]MDP8036378.1 helix-turn-helix domain-containing protein [Pasteurella atlantica]MDP8038332.1 helix-turn-helix domain-containing protein [Pasteurella atlantica]MDP8048682.1 helix-turn-helix domain-containing protein [Pasteurella atlantica]MDP8050615.1 helix-turn-helix domain-containing protein [Pasteurella atlantica]